MGAFRTIMARTFKVHSSKRRRDRFLTWEKYENRQPGSSGTLKTEDAYWRCKLGVGGSGVDKIKWGETDGWSQRGTRHIFSLSLGTLDTNQISFALDKLDRDILFQIPTPELFLLDPHLME